MNTEQVSTALNSTENRKKPLLAIDRIDIAIHRKAGKGYNDIKKPILPKSIQDRIHKKSYGRSATGVYIGRGLGSGFTNGAKLFLYDVGVPYECSGRKAKYCNTKNQIPDSLMNRVYEIDRSMPFRTYQLNLCENLLRDIQNNLNDSLPNGEIEFKCSGIEVYFEIPNSSGINNIRERIYKHLSSTLSSVPVTRSPQAGQDGPLQEWAVYLKEYQHKVPARITTYSKGNRIRVELKIDRMNCIAHTPHDLIFCLKRYVDEAAEILTRISHALDEQQIIPVYTDFNKEEFTRLVLEVINGKTTITSIASFEEQLRRDGYVFMPKPQAQYKGYYYFLKQMRTIGLIADIKASPINGTSIHLVSKKGRIFSLNPDWRLVLKKEIQKRKRAQRKTHKTKNEIESKTSRTKTQKVTSLLQDQIEKMPVHKQFRILSILTDNSFGTPLMLPYPKTVAEYLALHSANIYRLRNFISESNPNL